MLQKNLKNAKERKRQIVIHPKHTLAREYEQINETYWCAVACVLNVIKRVRRLSFLVYWNTYYYLLSPDIYYLIWCGCGINANWMNSCRSWICKSTSFYSIKCFISDYNAHTRHHESINEYMNNEIYIRNINYRRICVSHRLQNILFRRVRDFFRNTSHLEVFVSYVWTISIQ